MRINTHCHIFNVKSLYTEGFKTNFRSRTRLSLKALKVNISEGLLSELMGAVDKMITNAPTGASGDTLEEQRRFVKKELGKLITPILAGLLQGLPFMDFLSIALLPDMDLVTDHLFEMDNKATAATGDTDEEVLLAPLMMDIIRTSGIPNVPDSNPETPKTWSLLDQQVEGTQRQILRYPGKILPFYAVNPLREGFAERFKQAKEQGFVGLKLYPSLGYRILEPVSAGTRDCKFTEDIKDTMELCANEGYPALMHCNNGGFALTGVTSDWCAPNDYRLPLFDQLTKLIWCYGHFGGDEFFRTPNLLQRIIGPHLHYLWNQTIQGQMREMPGRIFGDISCHNSALNKKDMNKYFDTLARILEDEELGSQVLWGTDYFLVQMAKDEDDFWTTFKTELDKRDSGFFPRIACDNPVRYLGLPDKNGEGARTNIKKYAQYILSKRNDPNYTPNNMATWLKTYYEKRGEDYSKL